MERMLTVLFSDESKAYEGSRALKDLDSEGSISIYAQAVIRKNPDGTISIKQAGDEFPVRTVTGTAIGALIGLLGGPIGFSVGVAAGTLVGALADVHASGVNEDFLGEVSTRLTPGKWAVVSDLSEEWMTPVDNRMETLGGICLSHRSVEFRGRTYRQRGRSSKSRNCAVESRASPCTGRPKS